MNVKWVARVILLVLLAFGATACASPTPERPTPTPWERPTGTPVTRGAADLSAKRSQVRYRHPGEADKEVSVGQHGSVGTDDKINTDQTGRGILTFPGFLRVEIFRRTGLQVRAVPDPGAPLIVKLRQSFGTTLQQLQRQAERWVDVTTETEWATIRAVSTTYLISVDDDGVTWVVVFDGEVEVEAQGQTVVVRAGQATWVEPGRAPRSPTNVDSGAVEKWLEKLGGTGEVGPIRPVIQPSEEEEDQTDPRLEVGHWPEEPDETQEVTVSAEAGDDESGLDRIEIQMPGQPLVTCWESNCEAAGGPYPAGEYSYEVAAFDRAGNVAYRKGNVTVTAAAVQDNPPVVEAIYVEPATIYQGAEFRIKLVASDDVGLESMWWQMKGAGDEYLDNGDAADCGGITWCELSWNLEWTGRDGKFTIYAQARDTTAQLSSVGSTTITVLSSGARFSLAIGGGPFSDGRVQEAVGFAIDWAMLRDEIGEVMLVDFLSGETLAGTTDQAYDPERARALLEEVGYYGFDTALLFDSGDELAARLAEWVASYLYGVEIYPELVAVDSADARAKLVIMIEAGESGLLIERR